MPRTRPPTPSLPATLADAALESAQASGKKLTTTEVGGDSMTAMMSAQAILDARDAAAKAVTDAEAALAAAKKAETDGMAIADDHPQKAALMAAIDAAIKAAEAEVMAATAVRDGTKLKNAVAEVEGTNKKGTPRSIANSVGTDIADALAPGAQRTGTRIAVHGTTPPTATDIARNVMTNRQGMTWAEIVGESNVMSERIGTGNTVRMVASVAGMTAADVDSDVTAIGGTGGTNKYADAFTSATSLYKGIPGDIFCLGMDCEVDSDGKLKGSWYFSPTSPMVYYQRMKDNTETDVDESQTYEAETLYASYGHWLTVADGTDDWTVNTFSTSISTATPNVAPGTEDNGLEDTATYSGSAAGMSVRTMGSGDSKTTDSGAFTADVSLTANFGGATPAVRGTIDNFQGDAVGSGWSVNLESVNPDGSTTAAATGSGRDGVWSATAYGGGTEARPTGFHGGFVAHFADGDAAGAFATRKD